MNFENKSVFYLLEMGNNKDFQTNDYKELVKKLIGADFYTLSKNERQERIKLVATANATFKNLRSKELGSEEKVKIRDSYTEGEDINNTIYTCDDKAYILSLASNNIIMLFEKADSNILMNNIRHRSYESQYCVINTHSKELLKNHLNRQLDDHER